MPDSATNMKQTIVAALRKDDSIISLGNLSEHLMVERNCSRSNPGSVCSRAMPRSGAGSPTFSATQSSATSKRTSNHCKLRDSQHRSRSDLLAVVVVAGEEAAFRFGSCVVSYDNDHLLCAGSSH